MVFKHSTHNQSDYFEMVGRLIAEENNKKVPLDSKTNFNDTVLCVVINNSYGLAPIKHCVEIAWHIDQTKIKNVKYVLAVYDCTVVGVFELLDTKSRSIDHRIILSVKLADIPKQVDLLGRNIDGNIINGPVLYL